MTSLAPADAVEMYLDSRHDIAPKTKAEHRRRLKKFIAFADETDLDKVDDLDAITIEQYRQDRLGDAKTSLITDKNNLHTFRVFLRYLERLDHVESGLADKVQTPTVPKSEEAREVHLTHEEASAIVDYLAKYKWASTGHIVFHLTYHTGLRRGALHGLDREDWDADERVLQVRHRKHTPLKLGEEGERNLTISDDRLVEAMRDYCRDQRYDVEDKWGRRPFFASRHGRYSYKSLQNIFYRVTRPCYYADECPHNRDIYTCEAASHPGYSKCPSSVSSHPIRRSAIHHHLNENVPKTVCAERMAVSEETLGQHYDARSEEERRKARQSFIDDLNL